MPSKQRILIASDSAESAASLEELLEAAPGLSVETRVLDPARPDPLAAVAPLPDMLLLAGGELMLPALEALAACPPAIRPALIVVGGTHDPAAMRASMRAGARDFLTEPVGRDELVGSLARVAAEQWPQAAAEDGGGLTAFINAKGGSGGTFLACNTAYLFAAVSDMKTALLDLDLQFGGLPRYLDLEPKRNLLEALEVVGDLDGPAVQAYLTMHRSGLAVLASERAGAGLQQELMTDRFEILLELLRQNFDRLVVDVPRRIEPFGAVALERADRIVLVLQQTVPSLHDATLLQELLTRHLGVPPERIQLAVNRYHKGASVELADIERAFEGASLVCLPNDYRAVTESINIGIPIYEYARRSSVTKALLRLEQQLGGRSADASKSLFPRLRRIG